MSPALQNFLFAAVSSLLQVAVFTAIPLVVYVIRERKVKSFFSWIGLKAAPLRMVLVAILIGTVLSSLKLPLLWSMLKQEHTTSGALLAQFTESGWSIWLIGSILVTAWVHTALSEEIFFRGFVAARLIAWLGFRWGNLIQAAIFGLVHLPIIFLLPDEYLVGGVVAVVGAMVSGWVMGYLNQKADGSILPSWFMHGLGNTIAYSLPILIG